MESYSEDFFTAFRNPRKTDYYVMQLFNYFISSISMHLTYVYTLV